MMTRIGLASAASLMMMTATANPFTETMQIQGRTLNQCNQAEAKVMKFIHVADAALYSENCQSPLEASSVQLSFIYSVSIADEDFIEAADTLLKRNISPSDYDAIKTDSSRFNSGYDSVKKGDRYDMRRTETGLYLIKNGQIISHSDSKQLAQLYFQIWFGNDPYDKGFKQRLLTP